MKKLFALILAVALMATMSVTAFATDVTTNGGTGFTNVYFSVDPTYTVTIPAKVELQKIDTDGAITYENDYTITAEAGVRLLKNEYIEVTVASDYVMETPQGATLAYTITAEGTAVATGGVVAEFKTDKAAQSTTIHIAANDPDFAGEYKDTVTFTIAVKGAPITFKCWGETFTAEAGMTWGEWVNSPYNDGNNAYDWVFDTDGEHIYAVPTYYVCDDNGEVSPADVIVADYEYWSYA